MSVWNQRTDGMATRLIARAPGGGAKISNTHNAQGSARHPVHGLAASSSLRCNA